MDVGSLVEQESRADGQREAGVEEGEHGAPDRARDGDTELQGQTWKPTNRAVWVLDSIPVSLSEGGLRDCPCQPILIRNTLTALMHQCPPAPGPM